MLEKLYLWWPRWRQASNLLGRVVDRAPSPDKLVAGDCFGRLAENERLALGLIAGEPLSAPAAALEPSDEDPTESAG